MYTIEEFDKEKTKVLKYILYKKRSENEVRRKFEKELDENMLEDIIEYLKQAKYIDDKESIAKYGVIQSQVIYDDVTEAKNLLSKGQKYLLNQTGLSEFFRNMFTSYCSLPQEHQREHLPSC